MMTYHSRLLSYQIKIQQMDAEIAARIAVVCVVKVCSLYLLAEGGKWIQSLLILGGVTHHGVVTASSLQHREKQKSQQTDMTKASVSTKAKCQKSSPM